MRGMSSMRGTTQKTWPPRKRSRWMASRTTTESNGMMKVRTARRSTGGVAITLISRTPVSASCRVRGIGVAVRVSTCTSARSCFSRSLWATPKCCSSSITSRPSAANWMDLASSAWVPTTMLTVPSVMPLADLRGFLRGHHAGELRDAHGQAGEAFGEGAEVLAGEQRGRDNDRNLGARHRGNEGGAQRHLGLAETDIAADQPVHRAAGGKVFQHVGDGAGLVLGFGEGEAGAEFVEAAFRRRHDVGVVHLAFGGDADQRGGHVTDAVLHP